MEQHYSSSSSSFSSKQQEGENSEGAGCQSKIIMSLIKKSILSLQLSSLLSLIFLSSSLLFLFLHYSLKAATSSSLSLSSLSLPTFFSIDRNYMFLLCNGILVFLVKSSSLSSSESSADDKGGRVHDHDRRQSGIHIPASGGMGSGERTAEEKTGDGQASSSAAESDGADDRERSPPGFDDAAMFHGADNSSSSSSNNNDNNVQQHSSSSSEYQQVEESEEEEEEEEEEEGLDRDELNKRCEDFIRKMKEGIKAEAKQQMKPAFCFTSLRN